MGVTMKLAGVSLICGGLMGLLVLGVAAVAGRERKLRHWLGGTGWGSLSVALILTECLGPHWAGHLSTLSVPVFFAGLLAWPLVMAWGQPRAFLRWVGGQAVMLLALGPAYLAGLAAALCTLQ